MQPERIRVDSFYLADGAQVVVGKPYVLGGGWNSINLKRPNDAVALIAVVGRILVPLQESGRDLERIPTTRLLELRSQLAGVP